MTRKHYRRLADNLHRHYRNLESPAERAAFKLAVDEMICELCADNPRFSPSVFRDAVYLQRAESK